VQNLWFLDIFGYVARSLFPTLGIIVGFGVRSELTPFAPDLPRKLPSIGMFSILLYVQRSCNIRKNLLYLTFLCDNPQDEQSEQVQHAITPTTPLCAENTANSMTGAVHSESNFRGATIS
jgi:hypothetical protein